MQKAHDIANTQFLSAEFIFLKRSKSKIEINCNKQWLHSFVCRHLFFTYSETEMFRFWNSRNIHQMWNVLFIKNKTNCDNVWTLGTK